MHSDSLQSQRDVEQCCSEDDAVPYISDGCRYLYSTCMEIDLEACSSGTSDAGITDDTKYNDYEPGSLVAR